MMCEARRERRAPDDTTGRWAMVTNENATRLGRRPMRWPVACLLGVLLAGGAHGYGEQDEAQALQNRIDELLLRYTDKHPDVVAARKQLDELRAREQL